MIEDIQLLLHSLSPSSALWIAITIAAYIASLWLNRLLGRRAWLNPLVIGGLAVIIILLITGTRYSTYFQSTLALHTLLGPATVCLAVPLYHNFKSVRQALFPIVASLVVGSIVAIGSIVILARLLNVPDELIISMLPKSATTPVAIGISETIGGITGLSVAIVMVTGVTGAVFMTPLMRYFAIRDHAAQGFAIGIITHGVGTARALQVSDKAGAFSSIGMGLNAFFTAILVPIVLVLL